ncbi:hypothetical protein QIS99_30435 [Streptomyces sp. B-S-A8]|uniref:Uncharacterized protein n=1 Tax=Streptomyces solicavernae TaxID=3043614 RepID=A0ABT6S1B0_9ACTN|nr:hypothetical protein [Streptomyces sp. B-S-A8]MDI3390479.1 hypothetical protein [Streptomyces sp. B-S-A8]
MKTSMSRPLAVIADDIETTDEAAGFELPDHDAELLRAVIVIPHRTSARLLHFAPSLTDEAKKPLPVRKPGATNPPKPRACTAKVR